METEPASPAVLFPRDDRFAIPPGYNDIAHRRGRGVQWLWHQRRFADVEARLPPRIDRILDLGRVLPVRS